MFTHRVSKVVLVLLAVTIAFITVSFVARPAASPNANRSSANAEQFHAQPAYILLEKQEIREYVLGERYGVTPQGYAQEKALREYWLGERYGQRPATLSAMQ